MIREDKMTVGELLKQYRIANLKTQKEWAAGIISPSYYAKVEKNQHRITAEDLIALLQANNVGLWDFFKKLDKSDQRQHDVFNTIDRAINLAYYQNDAAKVREIREFVEKSPIADKEKLLLYIDAVLADIDNNSEELSPDKRAKLADLLFNFTDFDETELRVYINLMPFYDLKSNLIIGKKIIAKLQGSQNPRKQAELFAVIDNILLDCIEQNSYTDTRFFIVAAAKITIRPELFFYKNVLVVLENMINYHFDHQHKYWDKCKLAIKSFGLAGMSEYGNELNKFFLKYRAQ